MPKIIYISRSLYQNFETDEMALHPKGNYLIPKNISYMTVYYT